jgi:hypothetical protein
VADAPARVALLCGATLVLPDRVESGSTLVVEGGRIIDIVRGPRAVGAGETRVDLNGHVIVPGFVDVHVHGAMGVDVLDGPGAVAAVAAVLPRWGVTAFCPTTVACAPAALEAVLTDVRACRLAPVPGHARILGAHLESNFINPEYRGAQPLGCLRHAGDPAVGGTWPDGSHQRAAEGPAGTFSAWWTGTAPTSPSSRWRPRFRAARRCFAPWWRQAPVSPSATRAPHTNRRSKPSRPARGTSRISSIA